MGVAGLHAFLQPFGRVVTLGGVDDVRVTGCARMVVDGPALAYALWRQDHVAEGALRQFASVLEDFVANVLSTGVIMYV